MAQKESTLLGSTFNYNIWEFLNDTGADLNANIGEVIGLTTVPGKLIAACVHSGDGDGTLAQNKIGTAVVQGPMVLKKNTSKAFTRGEQVYWDASANEANDDTTANQATDFCVGTCRFATAASDPWVKVDLNFGPSAFDIGTP